MGSPSATLAWQSAIVVRLRANDDSALSELMGAYFDAVADVAFHYVRTIDAARDVAQTVFIRVWEHRHSLEVSGNIVHYLRRSARNAALDALDRNAAAARLAATVALDLELFHPHDDNSGLSAVEAHELTEAVRHAVGDLPPRVREVALLYLEQGLEPGEIAQVLGTAPRTVYNQLRRAMQHLTQVLGAWREPS
jgi:RNA polymerase sigma-70 factor (ECF subfamily)